MMLTDIVIIAEQEGQQVGASIKKILERNKDYRINIIGSARGREAAHAAAPHLLIAVLPAETRRAETLIERLRSAYADTPLLPVIAETAVKKAAGTGLLYSPDFLIAPVRESEVEIRVKQLTRPERRRDVVEAVSEASGLAQIIGEAPAFVALKRKIALVARFESTVLLTGETGTGKERFSRALHYLSRRAGKPFLPVNCGAIPPELFESELYGHRKGAFTSASLSQPGLIVEAEGGTLFLDEIESLSLASQVKLLRFLQDQTYYPLGSAKLRQADVWIIASTNVALPAKIQEGTFREDLYYRLAVINLHIPPLRERKPDIPLLASHFWDIYRHRAGRAEQKLSAKVMEALCEHPWPGNVRELQNVMQHLAVLTESQTVEPEDLPFAHRPPRACSDDKSFSQRKAAVIEEFEKEYITELLRTHRWNVTRAAQAAKKDRRAFGRLIKKYQIEKD